MKCSILLVLVLIGLPAAAQELPFKPKDEFDIGVDLKFKQRPADDPNTVRLADQPRKSSGALLPYLTLKVTFLKLNPEENRYRVENNMERRIVEKKIQKTPVIILDAGFTDDIKAKLRPSEYVITLASNDKADKSKVLIQIEKDGTFLVNGEKRGKF
jgi:hypothetical protein